MVIGSASTEISFYPFVSFEGLANVDIEVWHKETKTKVTSNVAVVASYSKITLALPTLTNIIAVAKDLDHILIRVFSNGILKWEYMGTWSNSSTDINRRTDQDWDQPTPPSLGWKI